MTHGRTPGNPNESKGKYAYRYVAYQKPWGGSIKHALSFAEGRAAGLLAASRRAQPLFSAQSVLPVREHGKLARTPPCLFHPDKVGHLFSTAPK